MERIDLSFVTAEDRAKILLRAQKLGVSVDQVIAEAIDHFLRASGF